MELDAANTLPCSHPGKGWCVECVATLRTELADCQRERDEAKRQRATYEQLAGKWQGEADRLRVVRDTLREQRRAAEERAAELEKAMRVGAAQCDVVKDTFQRALTPTPGE